MRPVFKLHFEKAKERFAANPPQMLNLYSVAFEDGGNAIACCGASLANEGPLLLEKIYEIAEYEQKLLKPRKHFAQIGRWIVTEPNVAMLVLKMLIQHLESRGIRFALCEMKSGPFRRATTLGLKFTPVDSRLVIDKVDPIEKGYYLEDPPRLYRLDFADIQWK